VIHLSPNKNGIFSKKGASPSPLSKYILFFIYRKLIPICLQKSITTMTLTNYQLMITFPKVLPIFSSSPFPSLSAPFLSVPLSLFRSLAPFLSLSRRFVISMYRSVGNSFSLSLSQTFCSFFLALSFSRSLSLLRFLFLSVPFLDAL
jgi:hypothetical protein